MKRELYAKTLDFLIEMVHEDEFGRGLAHDYIVESIKKFNFTSFRESRATHTLTFSCGERYAFDFFGVSMSSWMAYFEEFAQGTSIIRKKGEETCHEK